MSARNVTGRQIPGLPRISDYLNHWAAHQPEADFLLNDDARMTYGQSREQVDAFARGLLAAGVKRGDRIGAYGYARPEYFICFLAAASIGAIWLGLSPKHTLDELAYNAADAEPRVILGLLDDPSQGEVLSELQRRVPELEGLISRSPSSFAPSLPEFLAAGSEISDERLEQARAAVEPDDAAAVVYTSGSTGRPKGALLPHGGLATCCVVQYRHFITFEPLRVPCNLPINHVGCLGDISCSTLVAGGALFFMERFDAGGVLKVIERERLTLWFGVPTMLVLSTRTPEWRTADLSSLRRIWWSGGSASEELVRELARLGIPLSNSWGMTETVGSITYTSDQDPIEVLANTIGRPDPRFAVRIVRNDGSDCDTGEEGELIVAGPGRMLGYLNRPVETAEAIRDGWVHTGDAAVRRADGNFKLVGRLTDMYKSGGYNVYCREVEMALEAHPSVSLAAVVGVPDPLYGEVGCAFVVGEGRAPLDEDELRAHARERLANYKVPKRTILIGELPRLPIGKIDKRRLREIARSRINEPSAASPAASERDSRGMLKSLAFTRADGSQGTPTVKRSLMHENVIQYEVAAPSARITLNRPEKLNALNLPLFDGLRESMARAAADDTVRVVILRGAGQAFSAGHDLVEEVESQIETADAWHHFLSNDVDVTLDLLRLPKPTIAAVHGWCLAGGCELAMACDMIIATDDARFGEPEIRYGSGPATLLLPFLIGQKKTNELLFTGEAIDASEAERIGLINRVVAPDQLEQEVDALVAKIAPTPLAVLRYTKLGLLRSYNAMGLSQAVAGNLDLSAILNASNTPEQQEFDTIAARDGLKAALAWRDERYGGIGGGSGNATRPVRSSKTESLLSGGVGMEEPDGEDRS
jgi:acyl-CoA synthetase (AMP-forming)/AMP-acid ligase II/enoyl-CoA hydratase/carnithine racemase